MTFFSALLCIAAVASGPEVELLHFSSPGCVHCRTMEPTVERLGKAGHAIRHIDASEDPDTAAKYNVRGVPCFVVLVNGEERDRHEGTASYDRLNSMIVQARRAVIGDSESDAAEEPSNKKQEWRTGANQSVAQTAGEENFVSTEADSVSAAPKTSPAQIRQSALNSTVRIRIEDKPGTVSYGTGTIIDTRNDHALVITCGHLFRDSGTQGRITVDAIVDGQKKTIEAKVLDYDLEYEIGLLVMSPGGAIETVRVADASGQPEPGQALFSVGCNGGADPTVMEMQVTAVDRFTGAPNLECTGSPVQGRSGGGLFNEQGQLVAICFGALGGEARGAYSGLPTIHWLLKKHNLAEIFEASQEHGAPAAKKIGRADHEERIVEDRPSVRSPEKLPAERKPRRSSPRPAGELVAARDASSDENASFTAPEERTKPSRKPSRELDENSIAQSEPQKPAADRKADAAERSRLGRVLDEQLAKMDPSAEEAEVICIIKPKGAPTAKRKVLVLENPSSEFLTRLAHERHAQELFSSLPARKPAPAQVAKSGSSRSGGAKIAMRQDDSETEAH